MSHEHTSSGGLLAVACVVCGLGIVMIAVPFLFMGDDEPTVRTDVNPGVQAEGVTIGSLQSTDESGAPIVADPQRETWPLPRIQRVPDFTLTERAGAPVSTGDLAGKVVVVDFIFTNCAGTCPDMTRAMGKVQALLDDGDPGLENVRLLSISVDPERDTLPVLDEYATRYGAGEQWLYVRPESKEEVLGISYDGFSLGAKDDPIGHSSRLVLVDSEGWIRGYYSPYDEVQFARLQVHVKRLAAGDDPAADAAAAPATTE